MNELRTSLASASSPAPVRANDSLESVRRKMLGGSRSALSIVKVDARLSVDAGCLPTRSEDSSEDGEDNSRSCDEGVFAEYGEASASMTRFKAGGGVLACLRHEGSAAAK
jgi:hypothetical protein